jgi:hypothetical protein
MRFSCMYKSRGTTLNQCACLYVRVRLIATFGGSETDMKAKKNALEMFSLRGQYSEKHKQ